jgi:SAM-dependent methyltransferase
MSQALPLPPEKMRALIGNSDPDFFDNPSGALVFPDVPAEYYETVFDFGCGCGRVARQLIQQNPRPRRYVGLDVHKGMALWCQNNLTPQAENFTFFHHDVFNLGFNPGENKAAVLPFPVADHSFKLVISTSVFTHLIEAQAIYYMNEVARVLAEDGLFFSTWFTFDKRDFPMMQDFQNALYINDIDPTNAVIFDRDWLRALAAKVGLTIFKIVTPTVRGFQWQIHMAHHSAGRPEVEFPPDLSPIGLVRPPVLREDPSLIGLEAERPAQAEPAKEKAIHKLLSPFRRR